VALSGTGDADLYVRFGSAPTLSSYDCRPYEGDSSEECVLTVPANASSAFVDVRGFTASTYSLSIERVPGGGGGGSGGGGGTGGSGPGTGQFVIAVLGSSTAEGEGASSLSNSWVGLLEAELSEAANVSIINLARGGYTTLHLLPGSGAPGSIDDAIDESPDLIVVALAGSNDLEMGMSTADYLSHLTQLRDTARAAGIPTFFTSTTPKNFDDEGRFLLATWTEQMRIGFRTCWVPANSTYSPCFIDVFSDLANGDMGMNPEYVAADNFHHNDAGHRVIFQNAVEIIEPYVCTVTECD
jgi:lysophospholipase L1-like esterase